MKKFGLTLLSLAIAAILSAPFIIAAQSQSMKPKPEANASAEHTYVGEISDSMCGVKHMMPGGAKQCTLECVKRGAKYVLVTGGKVLDISNQRFADLEKNAGDHVRVTGKLTGDSIMISRIVPVKAGMKNGKTKTS
jgi:hypothetical protein